MQPSLGIDLGTTHSLCAVFRDGRPQLIPGATGSVLTPSVVGVTGDGRLLVGEPALELRVTQPDRCAWNFKRWMGTDHKVTLGAHTLGAPELSSLVLRALKDDAESFLGAPVLEAVITVPAYFNDNQRKATQVAAELAGLRARRIVNEPTAAALTYGFHDRQAEKKLLVFDLGGGTFDVSLMEVFEGTLEIVATAGESHLGGEDFTTRLAAWMLRQLGLNYEQVEFREPLRLARLLRLAEAAKRQLTVEPQAVLELPAADGALTPAAPRVTVKREDLRQATQELVERLGPPLFRALRDGQTTVREVDEVILVGGATRMPLVRDFVQGIFESQPLCTFDPDHVVALGACLQAALIADDAAVSDLVMTDVCPFTLGVEIVKQFGSQQRDGYYLPVIHRNTTIPVSREEVVSTVVANQRSVLVRVYQGEARRVQDNLLLGELEVQGLPPGPPGTPVHLRFSYDLNGVLEVEAYVPATGKKFQTVLTQHVKGLSRKEIEAAVRRLQALKFYPRDELRNQRLVRFCERLVGEVPLLEREGLEQLLDSFEASMASGDREYYERARRELLIRLSHLGHVYDEPS